MQALELEKERTRAAEAEARAAEADSRAAFAEARAATAERDLLLAKQGSLAARDYGAEDALHPRTDRRGRELSASLSLAPHSSSHSVEDPDEELGNWGAEANAQDEDEDAEKLPAAKNAEKPAAKAALQSEITSSFRRLCNIPKPKEWPAQYTTTRINPLTNEIYFSPNFDGAVNDPENRVEVGKIAGKIKHDWTESRSRNVHISETQVIGMVKESFRTVKKDWRRHFTPQLKAKLQEQQKRDRRMQRRVRKSIVYLLQLPFHAVRSAPYLLIPLVLQKSAQLLLLVDDYANDNQLIASVLRDALDEQYMSDELSEPESTNEPLAAWRVRMAAKCGHNTSPDAIKLQHYLEVEECEWRSPEYLKIIKELQLRYDERRTAATQGNIAYTRVCDTGRMSNRIPRKTPFDFMVNRAWLDANKGAELVEDWGTRTESLSAPA
ncbi:hypothetical protein B0H19DRAFT_1307661 [Mycena capillaripes]|nr:hypothetical protein B0H19DRAFT_1307661 [Mycena capillaripes]